MSLLPSYYQGMYYRGMETLTQVKWLENRISRGDSHKDLMSDLANLLRSCDELRSFSNINTQEENEVINKYLYRIITYLKEVQYTKLDSTVPRSLIEVRILVENMVRYIKSRLLDISLEQQKLLPQRNKSKQKIVQLEQELNSLLSLANGNEPEAINRLKNLTSMILELETVFNKKEDYQKLKALYEKTTITLTQLSAQIKNFKFKRKIDESLNYFKDRSKLYATIDKQKIQDQLRERGNDARTRGQYERALKFLDEAIAVGKEVDDEAGVMASLYEKAYVLTAKRSFNEALSIYKDLIKKDPKGFAWFYAGYVLGEMMKYKESINSYHKFLKFSKNNPDALGNLGWEYSMLGKLNLALKYYDKSLRFNPKNSIVLSNKADLLQRIGKYKKAIESYEQSLRLDPMNVNVLTAKIILLDRIKDKSVTRESKNAIKVFDEIIEKDGSNIDALVGKGIALDILKMRDQAIAWYDKALKIDPKNANALYNKACTKSLKKEYKESLKLLRRAVQLSPEYKETAKDDVDFAALKENSSFKKIVN